MMLNLHIKEKGDQEVRLERGIIFAVVANLIYHIQLYILMSKINMMEFFQLEVMLREKYQNN